MKPVHCLYAMVLAVLCLAPDCVTPARTVPSGGARVLPLTRENAEAAVRRSACYADYRSRIGSEPLIYTVVEGADGFTFDVGEEHETHVARGLTLRVRKNGAILRESYDKDGEIIWVEVQ